VCFGCAHYHVDDFASMKVVGGVQVVVGLVFNVHSSFESGWCCCIHDTYTWLGMVWTLHLQRLGLQGLDLKAWFSRLDFHGRSQCQVVRGCSRGGGLDCQCAFKYWGCLVLLHVASMTHTHGWE